jgi:hypothetical protein
MIRNDYTGYFNQIKAAAISLGCCKIEEEELIARFTLASGWCIEMECERYHIPSFTINIVEPSQNQKHRQRRFAIWLLMKVFEKKLDIKFGLPSLENQLKFLQNQSNAQLFDVSFYLIEYEELNEIKF